MSIPPLDDALACTIDAIPPEQRAAHRELTEQLFHRAAEAREELPAGYAFRFPAAAFDSVAVFVSRERLCCSFLDFQIALTATGTLWLRLSGPPGTRELLREELSI